MPICKTCQTNKPIIKFYKDKAMPGGHALHCKECRDEKTAQWRIKNRDKYNSDMRDYNKVHYRRLHLMRYKLTPDQYQSMIKAQDGKCKICNVIPKTKRPLAIDHCHTTNKVRGLLCYGCNRAIAILDKPGLLKSALEYLNITSPSLQSSCST